VAQSGGPAPEANALGLDFRVPQPAMGTWISPNQHSVVTDRDGTRHNVVIIPTTRAG
jgi:arsenite oxidase large subunit